MNSRKELHSCFVVCLSVLLGFSWTAPAAAGDAADLRLAAGPILGGAGNRPPLPDPPLPPLPAGPVGPGGQPLPLYNPPPPTMQERAAAEAKSKVPTFDLNKAPAPPSGTVLGTQPFSLGGVGGGGDWSNPFQFKVPGPGQMILIVTTLEPQSQMGLLLQRVDPDPSKPPGVGMIVTNIRKDGPTPLRMEFTVTKLDWDLVANKSWWVPVTTIRGPLTESGLAYYKIPYYGARGDLTVYFIPYDPAQKTPLEVPVKRR